MLINEVVDYCNQRWEARQSFSEPLLVKRGRHVVGQFGEVMLESAFDAIRLTDAPAITVGHIARLQASLSGRGEKAGGASARITDPAQIVDFDRLCRTTHMLNYLILRPEGGNILVLDVDPRHILAVPNGHGAYFADVIHRCGLDPSQVVLSTATGVWSRSAESALRLARGLANYRSRGYRVAVTVHEFPLSKLSLNFLFRVTPDYVRLRYASVDRSNRSVPSLIRRDLAHIRRLVLGFGGWILLEGVDDSEGCRLAHDAGIERLQGRFFDRRRKTARHLPPNVFTAEATHVQAI